jgi:hypothetical protein
MAKAKERYVIVRSERAGVFAGVLVSRIGQEVILKYSRRLWYWKGAASLSELAVTGTSDPKGCKFPVEVPNHEIIGVIEVLDVSDEARKSIASVPIWKA